MYIRSGDSGKLVVSFYEKDKGTFHIDTVGDNAHICSMSGTISGSKGHADKLFEDIDSAECDISISVSGTKVVVGPITQDACRDYCGMRADVYGIYSKPPAMCTDAGKQQHQARFMRAYRAKHYAEATNMLTAMMAQCDDFLFWIEKERMLNDLALSQYHDGNATECLETLNRTIAGKVSSQDELGLPPSDLDAYIDVANATWFNKALCTKKSQLK
ncbi:hypothetical protein EV582_2939 [Duganella sp. BK701]|nr:hypothetical protein EV582_2939 [Duganella sp. BK701]